MNQNPTCPRCGGSQNQEGLCPRCEMAAALNFESVATKLSDSQPGVPMEPQLATPAPHPACGHPLPSDGRGAGGEGTRSFGDYELLEEIARGGMGIVYKARQKNLNRTVAVKMILSGQFASKQIAQRFKAEAIAAAVLQHPHIVAVHEVGVHEGQHFFSMDYVEGQNLTQLVGNRPLPARTAARYLKQIAEAIHHAHQQGILHRDLKPSNVLIDAASDQPRVTDFGLAKRLDGESSITITGQVLGSPNFMPPEQASVARGKVGRPSDVYGLGGILYFLLTARAPFQGQTIEATIHQTIHNEPIAPRLLNASVPRDLETICLKCLEKEPTKRYASAQELADELGRFLNDEPIHARPVTRVERAWRWCRRKPALVASLVTMLVLVLIISIGSPIAAVRINQARQLAEANELKARRNLYTGDMSLAFQALDGGNLGRTRQLLGKYQVPGSRREESPSSAYDLRGWEWRYLHTQTRDQSLAIFGTNMECVYRLSFSPDGRFLASSSADNRVWIWDWPSHRVITNHLVTADVSSAAFTPNGRKLITGERGGMVRVYRTDSWAEEFSFAAGKFVLGLAVSPDSRSLAIVLDKEPITIWSIETRQVRQRIPARTQFWIRSSIIWSPSGNLLAFGTDAPNPRVELWDVASDRSVASLPGHERDILAATFSPDGQWLASGSEDGLVLIWEVKTRRKVAELSRNHAVES